ncbi:MAG: hypothetical protein LLG04_04910 [Parachlamydia sp.]|nr:hypothetical protein [Parachlamydia sp.]
MTSAMRGHSIAYVMTAVDEQSTAVFSHSQIHSKIQQSPHLSQLFDKLRPQFDRLKPCSFSVSWIALPLPHAHPFEAIQFKVTPKSFLDFHVKFGENQIAVFKPTRRGLRPRSCFFSKETGAAIKEFVYAFEIHTLLEHSHQTPDPLNECCTPLFRTPVFTHYLRQLRDHLSACADSSDKSRLQQVLNLFSSCDAIHRPAIHDIFFQELRRSDSLAKSVSSWLYNHCDLSSGWWGLLLHLTNSQMPEPANFLEAFPWYVQALAQNPSLSEARPCLSFDMLSAGNLPSFLWEMTHSDGSVTRIIRTCTVLYHVHAAQRVHPLPCQLLPEFEQMLKDLKGFYLYFDLRATPEETCARQYLRSALQKLPGIKLFRIDRDSERYDQVNQYSQEQNDQLTSPEFFKKKQLDYLQHDPEEDNCFWTDDKEKELWVKHFAMLQNRIHEHYFDNSAMLTDEERNDLNELALLFMAYHKLLIEKPALASFSCFMSADRGPSFYTLLYILHCHTQGIPLGPLQIKLILSMLLVPAIVTENRMMQEIRLRVFWRVVNRLLSRPPLH